MNREVLALMFEFVLSIVVLVGGGFLVYSGHGQDLGIASITAVITFWFSRRQSEQNAAQNEKTIDKVVQQVQAQQSPSTQAEPQPTPPTNGAPLA